MFNSRTKTDLMIEVWEALDCENVGAKEILAIEKAVIERFGKSAVETPMRIARLLADEGAELRHSEIMELDVSRRQESPYAPMFLNILQFEDFKQTQNSLRQIENLRKKFQSENDKEGLRLIRESLIRIKRELAEKRSAKANEIAEWITIWLQSPEIFENWIDLRRSSSEFQSKFPE